MRSSIISKNELDALSCYRLEEVEKKLSWKKARNGKSRSSFENLTWAYLFF